ncbi:Uncharacterised protein [Bordetella pertussis]|nr:Uncharacterised protein [Bordetella pertussis]
MCSKVADKESAGIGSAFKKCRRWRAWQSPGQTRTGARPGVRLRAPAPAAPGSGLRQQPKPWPSIP